MTKGLCSLCLSEMVTMARLHQKYLAVRTATLQIKSVAAASQEGEAFWNLRRRLYPGSCDFSHQGYLE